MKIVIIEDEPLTADDLAETILMIDSKAQIVAKLPSIEEAIEWFNNNDNPDLIFSDIQLTDGISFEIFKTIPCNAPVIFCTAYDEYALKAFKANGIDYILKPFTKNTIDEAINKYKLLKGDSSNISFEYDKIIEVFENNAASKNNALLVNYKDKIIPLQFQNIGLLYLENEITYLITFDNKKYSVNKSLEEIEKIINNEFYRANRQYLINRKAVKEASHYFGRKLSVSLNITFNKEIIINKEKVSDFLNWLTKK